MFWRRRNDEDDVDRLNRVWTVLILVVAAVAAVVYVAVFPDSAIHCESVGNENSRFPQYTQYANKYCLGQGSFKEKRYYNEDEFFSYHTFVPLFLFYKAVGFLAPHILVLFLKRLKRSPAEFLFLYAESKGISHGIDNCSKISAPKPSSSFMVFFILKKVLFLVNSIIQFVLVAAFLSPDKRFESILDVYNTGTNKKPFPEYGRCRVDLEEESTMTFQCAFHINSVYKKVFMFLFYWFFILVAVNIASLIQWLLLLLVPALTQDTVNTCTQSTPGTSDAAQQDFVKTHLGKDFLLYLLLTQNTEREVTAVDLTNQLWQKLEQPPPAKTDVETSQM